MHPQIRMYIFIEHKYIYATYLCMHAMHKFHTVLMQAHKEPSVQVLCGISADQ